MGRISRPPLAERGTAAAAGRGLLAAAGDRRDGAQVVGQPQEDPLDVLVDGRRQQRQRLLAGRLRREVGIGRVGGQQRCACWPMTPPELLQAARGSAPGRSPSSSSASSQPSRPSATNSWATPSVVDSVSPRSSYQPAQRRDVRELAVGQEAQHLQLGVAARLQPAEHLQRVARRRRRSTSWTARSPSGAPTAGRRACSASSQKKLTLPTVRRRTRPARRRRRAITAAWRGLVSASMRQRRPSLLAQQQLVELVRAGLEAHLDQADRGRRARRTGRARRPGRSRRRRGSWRRTSAARAATPAGGSSDSRARRSAIVAVLLVSNSSSVNQ